VTNTLLGISDLLKSNDSEGARFEIQALQDKYQAVARELLLSEVTLGKAQVILQNHKQLLLSLIEEGFSVKNEKVLVAQGEIISTNLFTLYLQELQEAVALVSALDFMVIDGHGEPAFQVIRERLTKILNNHSGSNIWVTQGFICRDDKNEIDNLQRGGSDYTASIIGSVLDAKQIQIWTDIDGMHNNDPRYVPETFSIEEISFHEAAELAYFGAKILHPQSIIPAQEKNIPVLLKNTFKPESKGTLIHNRAVSRKIRAIAAKDNITAIKIKSYRMLMAYGFLKKIFEVFEQQKTAIDMITTSEVAVSLTIDNTSRLDQIIQELKGFGNIDVDTDLSIICIAGDLAQNKKGITAAIFNSLKDIPIRMISYGGSNYNLSFLVKTADKTAVLNLLNQGLFADRREKQAQPI